MHGQEHVEGYLELSAKTKIFLATAVALWNADFYVKVDDDVHVNIGKDAILLDELKWSEGHSSLQNIFLNFFYKKWKIYFLFF